MANFLADVGRSDLKAIGSNLIEKAVDIRRTEAESELQMLDIGMKVEDHRKDQRIKQAQVDEIEEKKRFNEFRIPVESVKFDMKNTGMPTEAIDTLYGMARDNNMIQSGQGGEFITRGDANQLTQMMQENTTMKNTLLQSTVDGYEREAMELEQALKGDELKGKEADAAKERLAILKGSNGLLAMGYNALKDELPEVEETDSKDTPRVFTPTLTEAAQHGLESGKQYMAYFDDAGKVVRVLREATSEEMGGPKPMNRDQAAAKLVQYSQALTRLDSGQDIGTDLFADDPELQKFFAGGASKDAEFTKQVIRNRMRELAAIAPGIIPDGFLDEEPASAQPDQPGVIREGDVSRTGTASASFTPPAGLRGGVTTGTASAPVPPPELPPGSTFIKRGPGGEEYWTNPDNPKKAFKVSR